jgi:hypothetical protein
MQPDQYSELFFLDEATAFAAGHRPCGECRRDDYRRFKRMWLSATALDPASMDSYLHGERVTLLKTKRTFESELGTLPQGVMLLVDGEPVLKWRSALLRWSSTGYSSVSVGLTAGEQVEVLTPTSIVQVLADGYPVQVHESANG